MRKPHQFKSEEAHRMGMPPGWWVMDDHNRPVIGPYLTKEAAVAWIERKDAEDAVLTTPVSVVNPNRSAPGKWVPPLS